ncbi:MAG: methyltransferase domain-containing protein [Pseudomonadales bacterium]|nr:methyltransferase domain-containing protein [Pseudomonadales bacterium]
MKFRYQDYQVGPHKIRLRTLRDLDQYIDTGGAAEAAGISRDAFPLFGIVWTSAEVLSKLLLAESLAQKKILEIGCGMALASHLLNRLGEDITAMDIHPVTRELLDDNSRLNTSPVIPFVEGSWSDPALNLGEFDLIIGSDILYEPKHIKNLAGFLDRHLAHQGKIIIVDPDRGQSEHVITDMKALNYQVEVTDPQSVDELGIPFDGSIFRFTRA